uniref:Uncharacterized protein n=1 Tax=Trichinella nativa TaxID=6335 RepID=A0A0V1KHA5_9BILA
MTVYMSSDTLFWNLSECVTLMTSQYHPLCRREDKRITTHTQY